MSSKALEINYKADGVVVRKFLREWPYASLIRGPIGSGKSAANIIKILMAAMRQKPSPIDNVRYTRFAVVRRTNPQLKTTTIKTWLQWIPEFGDHGVFKWSPPYTHHLKFALGDGTFVDCEVIFMPLDRPSDVDKLLSFELTGIFFNEAREIDKEIVDAATGRVGRYPDIKHGGPNPWFGLMLDTNAPDEEHWWAVMSGDVPPPKWLTEGEKRTLITPPDWKFYTQPPAMLEDIDSKGNFIGYKPNPKRENKVGVTDDYYRKAIQGKSKDWIDVYILNKYGTISAGKPVYPSFSKNTHVTEEPIKHDPEVPIIVGIDFGRTPCAVFMHNLNDGRLVVFHELQTANMGAEKFTEILTREIVLLGLDEKMMDFVGDPSGDYMGQSDDKTPFRIMRAAGIPVRAASTNDPIVRIGAVEHVLNNLVNGSPMITISPTCKILISGFEGGYMYRKKNVSDTQYEEKPFKNKFSHLHDALQYAVLKAGYGKKITTGSIGGALKTKRVSVGGWNVFSRRNGSRR